MLAKYYRFIVDNQTDKDIDYNSSGRVFISLLPWKMTAGAVDYGSEITGQTTMDFDAGDEILTGTTRDGEVIDNSANPYLGAKGTFRVAASDADTIGYLRLFLEESVDNVVWPHAQADFDLEQDCKLVAVLNASMDISGDGRAKNFEIGESCNVGVSRRRPQLGTIATNALTAEHPEAWDGLIVLYGMSIQGGGDTVFDLTGQGNDAANNGASWMMNALEFVSAETDYILNTTIPASMFSDKSFSIVLMGHGSTASSAMAFCSSRSTANTGFSLNAETWSDSGKLGFTLSGTADYASTLNTPTDFSFIACVIDGATATFYLDTYDGNGIQTDSVAIGAFKAADLSGLFVGGNYKSGGIVNKLDGKIQWFALVDRALSAAEIANWRALEIAYPLRRRRPLIYKAQEEAVVVYSGRGVYRGLYRGVYR